MVKQSPKKTLCGILALAIFLVGVPSLILTAGAEADNYIKNPSFEDTDGGTVPDYSPNEWTVSSGWFVNTDPSAQEGNNALVAIQNGLATQTVTLPDGEYDFSGYMNAAGTDITIKITLTSGDNEKSVSLASGSAAGYQSISSFTVTGGSVTVKLESTFVTAFTSGAAVIDDLKLAKASSNAVRNPSFEDTDGGAVPDYSPNEWVVSSGWYINTDPSAQDGTKVMVSIQNGLATQTISLPDGEYDFSGYMNAAGTDITIKITLSSGDNEKSISLKSGDAAGYQSINRFAVTGGSVTIKLESAFVTAFTSGAAVIDDLKLVKVSPNVVRNPSFEDTDGGAVPDYSPNEWVVSSGWYINTDPSAQDGTKVMVSVQNGLATQTISLPDGEYNFSGYMNAAGTDIDIKITLSSGDNEKSISLKSGDAAGYQSINRFAVTGGSVTIKLESAFVTPFTSGAAVIDDLKLIDSSAEALPEVEITFDANGGKGIMNPQKVEQGVATPLKDNVFKYGKHAFVGWNTRYMMMVVIIVQLWVSLGTSFLTMRAGFSTVDRSLLEAGLTDGIKNRFQELWYITLPSMTPHLLLSVILSITGAFGAEAAITVMTGFPSTGYATHTIMHHLRDYGFIRFQRGYACAIAVVLFLMCIAVNRLAQILVKRIGK